MKIVENNENMDIIEAKIDKKDIVCITLIDKATTMNKKTGTKYMNGTFLKIINRKGDIRVLDLISSIDITNMLEDLEIVYSNKTTEKEIFIEE